MGLWLDQGLRAQAFLGQGATSMGNTGYGYGDSDLLACSERLMAGFVIGHPG